MKILVCSDTHGNTSFIDKLTRKHQDCSLFLHAGDSLLSKEQLYPFETVKGNCDYYISNQIKVIKVKNINILMFHGDKFSLNLEMLTYYANNHNAQILIHGHTHIPYYNYYNGVHILCPGSIILPKVTKPTYAIITIDDNYKEKVRVEFYNYDNR